MKALFGKLRAFGLGGAANLLIVAGGGLVSVGAGEIYRPAGLVVAGLLCLGLAWLLSRAA